MPDLHYATAGNGAPLLILHGLFGSSKNWQSFMRRFGQNFEVFSVDLRNHGQSFHSEIMSYAVMADDVARLIEQLGLHECRILGHSMGGKVAMTLAIQRPELLSRMIVADIAPVAYTHQFDDVIEPILALELDSFESRAQIDQALQADINEDSLRAFLLSNLVREDSGWGWRVNWPVIQKEMAAITGFDPLPEGWLAEMPAQFIRGANSDYVGDAEIELIGRHFRDFRIDTIDGAGHWLHAEKPTEFTRLALDFLA